MPARITWLSSTSGPAAAGAGGPPPWSDGPPRVPLCGSAKISTWSSRTVSVISRPSEATNSAAISSRLTSGDGTSTRNPRAVRSPPLLKLMKASKDARYSATRPRLDLRADDHPAADGDVPVGTDGDDHPHVGVGDRVVQPVAALQRLVELAPRIRFDPLHRAPDLEEPVLVVRVGDGQRDPRLAAEVGELLPGAGVRQPDPRPVPGEPHHAALR